MLKMEREQIEALRNEVSEALKGIDPSTDTKDIVVGIYKWAFPDTTDEQAVMTADELIDGVSEFRSMFESAIGDLDKFLDDFQERMEENKTDSEICEYWAKVSAFVDAFNEYGADSSDSIDMISKRVSEVELDPDEVNVKTKQKLREKAKIKIASSDIVLNAFVSQSENLEQIDEEYDMIRFLSDASRDEQKNLTVAAALAYVKIRKGEIEEIPADIDPRYVAAVTCVNLEELTIMEKFGNDEDMLKKVLKAFDILCIVCLCSLFAFGGAVFALSAITAAASLNLLPASLMLFLFIITAEAAGTEIKSAIESHEQSVQFGYYTINMIKRDIKKLAERITDKKQNIKEKNAVPPEIIVN